MSFALPVFVATCYSVGMVFLSSSKEDTYADLYDQLMIVKQVKDKAISSAENDPHQLTLVDRYFTEAASSRKSEFYGFGQMITPNESREKLHKLDCQLKIIHRISPFNILTKALFGNIQSWRRERPIPL